MVFVTRLALRWRLATGLITALIIAGGIWTLARMNIELLPDIDFPLVTVVTAYPQADSPKVLSDVTIPVEDAVSGLGGLKQYQSISSPNRSIVIAEFEFGTDMEDVERTVSRHLDGVTFPAGVQPPQVARVNLDEMPVVLLSASRPGDPKELETLVLSEVVPMISEVRGVFAVEVPTAAAAGTSITRTNGSPSVAVSVIKEPDANTVDVVHGVMDMLE